MIPWRCHHITQQFVKPKDTYLESLEEAVQLAQPLPAQRHVDPLGVDGEGHHDEAGQEVDERQADDERLRSGLVAHLLWRQNDIG